MFAEIQRPKVYRRLELVGERKSVLFVCIRLQIRSEILVYHSFHSSRL